MAVRTEIDEVLLRRQYESGIGCTVIARHFGCAVTTIENRLRKIGVQLRDQRCCHGRLYPLNVDYFADINTQNKAYILGLIYADGNIANNLYSFSIQLKLCDRYILEKIRNELYPDRTAQPIIGDYQWRGIPYPKLTISSQKVVEDLCRRGLMPNKTGRVTFPEHIPHHLVIHFIRGYFDGNGTVGIANAQVGPRPFVSISGNAMMISALRKIICESMDINVGKVVKTKNSAKISVGSIYDIFRFEDALYYNATLFLTRKKSRFIDIRNKFSHSMYANHRKGGPAPGVCWDKGRSNWIVTVDGKYIGRFADMSDAMTAAKQAREK